MTRKHFKQLADALRHIKPPDNDDLAVREMWRECVLAVATVCENNNAHFKQVTFLHVAGLPEDDMAIKERA